MKAVCNVVEQKEYDGFPRVIDNVLNPPIDYLAKMGWFRLDGKEPEPTKGYRAVAYRYIGDLETMTARKFIISEVNIADEKLKAEAAAIEATHDAEAAQLSALESEAADCADSLPMRVLIALGVVKDAETVYIEARKQLGLK